MKFDIVKYFIISCLATGIDFSISYLLYREALFNYLISSNIGIVSGFIFQYFTSVKYIFKNSDFMNSFVIYIVTFLFGIFIANSTIWISFRLVKLSFPISKGFSIAVPFFITYFIRKKLLA